MAAKKKAEEATKDHTDADVKKALSEGKELPSGTVLRFYDKRAVDVGTGEVATGDDGNFPSDGV